MKETRENPPPKMQGGVHDEAIIPQIVKQDVKINSRVLSRESFRANSSSRVFYYGGAKGAVPFLWESQPGTPKHTLVDTYNAPPLTPPPSYYGSPKSKSMYKNTKPRALRNIFSKLAHTTKAMVHDISNSPSLSSTSTSSSSSTWSATSYPSPSSNSRLRHEQNRASCSRIDPFFGEFNQNNDDIIDEENENNFGSPTSTLRFNGRSRDSMKFLGCYPMKNMAKGANALLSIAVRRGSNKRST